MKLFEMIIMYCISMVLLQDIDLLYDQIRISKW